MRTIYLLLALGGALLFCGCNAQKNTAAVSPVATVNSGEQGARTKGAAQERMARQTQELVTALGLTEDQATQLRSVNEKYAGEFRRLRSGGSRPDRATMMKLRQDHTAAVKEMLTAEQRTTYDKIIAERRAQRPRNGRRPGGGGR